MSKRLLDPERAWWPYVVPAFFAVAHSLYFLPRTVDDLFIFLRYAENLSLGHGLVYNLGEPVEGFSSPIWTLLLAFGHLCGLGGVSLSKVLGLASLVAVVTASVHILYARLSCSKNIAFLGGLLVAANSYIVNWSVLGLETPLHLACLLWGLDGLLIHAPRRTQILRTGLILGVLSLSRPEGALDVAGLSLGALIVRLRDEDKHLAMKHALGPAFIAGGLWLGYEVFRLLYFGLPFPHTYYAKPGRGFNINRWAPLIRNGASLPEIGLLFVGGAGLFLAARRLVFPILCLLIVRMYFIGSVEVDWMPNLRHFQPIYLGFVLLSASAVHESFCRGSHLGYRTYIGLSTIVACGLILAWSQVDSRFGPWDYRTHGAGKTWVRTKTNALWLDTWHALRRVPPEHVKTRGPGMLQQAYNVMDASAKPMDRQWFIGRDIGRVGWLTPVQVMETAGLFTPMVVQSKAWQKTAKADAAMVQAAFQRDVIATELLDGWADKAQKDPSVRQRYQPVYRNTWIYLKPKRVIRPTLEVRVARYRYALSRLPTRYYAMTLYGEAVGAILERDLRKLESKLIQRRR